MKFKLLRGFQNDGLPGAELNVDDNMLWFNHQRTSALNRLHAVIRENLPHETIERRRRNFERISRQYNMMVEIRIIGGVFNSGIINE